MIWQGCFSDVYFTCRVQPLLFFKGQSLGHAYSHPGMTVVLAGVSLWISLFLDLSIFQFVCLSWYHNRSYPPLISGWFFYCFLQCPWSYIFAYSESGPFSGVVYEAKHWVLLWLQESCSFQLVYGLDHPPLNCLPLKSLLISTVPLGLAWTPLCSVPDNASPLTESWRAICSYGLSLPLSKTSLPLLWR